MMFQISYCENDIMVGFLTDLSIGFLKDISTLVGVLLLSMRKTSDRESWRPKMYTRVRHDEGF
jgi:hypothetical protein